jgi:hypothetical protein
MKIAPAQAKFPWKYVLRILPGILGIAGGFASQHRVEQGRVDNLKRIEDQQRDLGKEVEMLASRLKVLFWIATAALAVAIAALAFALIR